MFHGHGETPPGAGFPLAFAPGPADLSQRTVIEEVVNGFRFVAGWAVVWNLIPSDLLRVCTEEEGPAGEQPPEVLPAVRYLGR